jgi:hypothetical protein
VRGDTVFRIYGVHEGREKDSYFGAFRTRDAADAEIAKLNAKEMHGHNWARQHHNKGFVIRTATVETDFEPPPRPKPRDRYFIETALKSNEPGTWPSTIVRVFERSRSSPLCEYERNHAMYGTFEPFRQPGRELALISRDYTRTAVLDLASGQVIAEEPGTAGGGGFCPVGFYVPDWLDVNDDSIIPGSAYWDSDCEWPTGNFGFVWGCVWGDDSSWKIQYLNLSKIEDGIIEREERFGYVELALSSWRSPCFTVEAPPPKGSDAPDFISVTRHNRSVRAKFHVEMDFDLTSGNAAEWRRES